MTPRTGISSGTLRSVIDFTFFSYCSSCYSPDSKSPHHSCHILNEIENIDLTPDIPYILQLASSSPPKLPFPWGDLDLYGLLGPPDSTPNGTSIGSSVFCMSQVVTNRHADRPRPCCMCNNRLQLCTACMQCGLIMSIVLLFCLVGFHCFDAVGWAPGRASGL